MQELARKMLQPVGTYVANGVTKCSVVCWTVLNPTRISMPRSNNYVVSLEFVKSRSFEF